MMHFAMLLQDTVLKITAITILDITIFIDQRILVIKNKNIILAVSWVSLHLTKFQSQKIFKWLKLLFRGIVSQVFIFSSPIWMCTYVPSPFSNGLNIYHLFQNKFVRFRSYNCSKFCFGLNLQYKILSICCNVLYR